MADTLYRGHLAIADTFRGTSRITVKLSCKNLYIAETFTAGNCYSGQNVLAPREKLKPNLLLYSGHPTLFVGK